LDKAVLNIIISGCLQGDSKHKKAFYELFSPHILSVSYRYARNRTDAEDIFQESILKIFCYLQQLNELEKIEWWIKRIVINEAIRFYKKNRSLVFVEDYQTVNSSEMETSDVYKTMEVAEVLKVIQVLPDRMRLVINLFSIEGFSHEEIAEMLGISVGTSKSNLFDARKKIKILMHEKVRRII
jgi:RNA polymerase sigma-70 factor (ECF subfamily)